LRDNIFQKEISKQFEFDEEVASVFDDMLDRSVPFYKEILNLSVKFALLYSKENSSILDLGCSTATTLIEIAKNSKKKLNLIGIDNSEAMIKLANKKIKAYNLDIKLQMADILEYSFKNNDVIISNYTLQFIRPLNRQNLVNKIYKSLNKDGVFLFSEKVIANNKRLNKEFIDIYYEFKKSQGYSDFEIAKKREALENVLIPYSIEENIKMVKDAGFKEVEILFKWINFALFLAKK